MAWILLHDKMPNKHKKLKIIRINYIYYVVKCTDIYLIKYHRSIENCF